MPKKHNRLGMVAVGIVAVLVVTAFFALNGLLPKLDLIGGNRLLVVIPDSFTGDSMLNAYLNARSVNWTADVATLSQITGSESYNNTQNYLMIRQVDSITSDATCDIMWYDGSYFHVFASNYGGFHQCEVSPLPQKALIWYWTAPADVTFNYDNNTPPTVFLHYSGDYINWGLHYIVMATQQQASVYTYCGPEMAIHDYAVQHGANYLFLVGDLSLVPSWQMMNVENTEQYGSASAFDTGETDRPYCYRDLNNVVPTALDIKVGRLPVGSKTELDIYLNKDLNYVSHEAEKAIVSMGNGINSSNNGFYEQFISDMNTYIKSAYPNELVDASYATDPATFISILQNPYDNIAIFAHGGYSVIDGISTASMPYISLKNNCVLICVGCSCSDFSRLYGRASTDRCIGEAFIDDADSKLLAFMGGTLYMYGDQRGLYNYYRSIAAGYATLGAAFNQMVSLEGNVQMMFDWELFGDPTLVVSQNRMIPELSTIVIVVFMIVSASIIVCLKRKKRDFSIVKINE